MNELYHYGVLGMKWGVRKNEKKAVSKGKRHLGINEKGNISFINEKTTNEAKAKFETAYTEMEKRFEKLINMRNTVEELLDKNLKSEIIK